MILRISLKPLDKFFFGGENSFQEAGSDDDRRATYLLHSRKYPQQTGALGLIRNQLLLQNGLLWDNSGRVSDKAKAGNLIGKKSFRIDSTADFGVIKAIGPVFLTDGHGNDWWPAPLDDVEMVLDDQPPYPMQLTKDGGMAVLQGYTEKSGLYATLQNGVGSALSLEAAFRVREQVGITKATSPSGVEVLDEEDERGYYYQGFYHFAPATRIGSHPDRFCFYVQVEGDADFQLNSALVEMGGERSTFHMDVEEDKPLTALPSLPAVHYHHTTRAAGIKTLICLSPCWVKHPDQLRELALLQATEALPFRFLQSSVDDTAEHQNVQRTDRKNPNGSLLESKLYHLLDRGSVIHFDASDADIEKKIIQLFNHASLQKIGYNQYCII